MRIDNNDLSGINSTAAGESQKVRTANEQAALSPKPGKVGTNQDEVHLSSVADHVNAGNLTTGRSVSAERSARIDQLTKLVQSGQYHPDPARVADSMIRDMLAGTDSP